MHMTMQDSDFAIDSQTFVCSILFQLRNLYKKLETNFSLTAHFILLLTRNVQRNVGICKKGNLNYEFSA